MDSTQAQSWGLSAREEQIIRLAARGLTDKEIAVKVGVAVATVRTYWDRLRQKTGTANRAQSVAQYVHAKIQGKIQETSEFDTLMQAASDASLGGILVLDQRNRVIAANEKAYALLNTTSDLLIGTRIHDLVRRRREALDRLLQEAREENAATAGAYTISVFLTVNDKSDLLVRMTIRAMGSAMHRQMVVFFQDAIEEIDARRKGHHSVAAGRKWVSNGASLS